MPSVSSAARVALLAFASVPLGSAVCLAGGPLGPNGTPIQTSDYAIDLYQGPVFAGSRVTGLAGAYVAISEDVDGDLQNPASPAVRPFFSYSHFDYWIGFGLTFPATLNGVDFFNSGKPDGPKTGADSFLFFVPALNLQWGELGVGLTLELSSYALSGPQGAGDAGTQPAGVREATIAATISTFHLQLAHGFAHNQLVFGLGARITAFTLDEQKSGGSFNSSGNGYELGVVYKPERLPLRLGAALRTAIRTEALYKAQFLPDENGDLSITNAAGQTYYLPQSVALPWDLNVGVAVQFGRPINHPWRSSDERVESAVLTHRLGELEREKRKTAALAAAQTEQERQELRLALLREQLEDDQELEVARDAGRNEAEQELVQLNRRYLQLSASLLVSGPVEKAIGVESFLSQTIHRSGQKTVYSPRLGAEVGVIPEWLKVRGGTYLEPTRFETSDPRLHGTFGLDLRLINWNVFGLWPDDYVWRLGAGGDTARDYFTWGVTIGGWYPRRRTPQ